MLHRSPIIFRASNGAASETLVGAGPNPLSFGQVDRVLAGITITGGNTINIGSVDLEGAWDIEYHIGGDGTNNVRSNFEAFLTLNGAEVPATRGQGYVRNALGVSQPTSRTYVDLTNGDTLQVQLVRLNGTTNYQTRPNSVWIMMERKQ